MPKNDPQEVLDRATRMFGFVPNLIQEMARNPAVATVYLDGQEALAGGTLSNEERQVVQLAISAMNRCDYCMAAHLAGLRMSGVPDPELEAIARMEEPEDERLRALTTTVWKILEKRGFLSETDLADLGASRIDRSQLYEIIALIGLKTITNYINHINRTELDDVLKPHRQV
jgi:AhpD family alkylhydroperoxidase